MMWANSSPLLIDDRAGSKELEPFVTAPHQITRLGSADFAIIGNGPTSAVSVGVERKTVSDLISSMESGRLSGHQLIQLSNDYDYVYILVEGLWRPRSDDGILEVWSRGKWKPYRKGVQMKMARDISNYLNTLAICCGVIVWRTDNIQQTGRWLSDVYRWWHKPWDKHRAHIKQFNVAPPPTAMLRKPTLLHRLVKELDGIGWDKGKALADHFGSLAELLFATEKQIKEVPGIGKVLAKRVHKELEELR